MTKKYIILFLLYSLPTTLLAQGVMTSFDEQTDHSQYSQSGLTNIPGRKTISLNGKWKAIIDPYNFGAGTWAAIWKDKIPTGKTDFYEYSFDNGAVLDVPGDFNSQLPELYYFEGTVWYKKTFNYHKINAKRLFIHFGAVSYKADIYLNSDKIGSHEGGFTPFQFELTDRVKEGNNTILVRANNERVKDGIPALGFDWFNYGGITRDVNLVETPADYIEDYFIQLQKGSSAQVQGWVKLAGAKAGQTVQIQIPEAKIKYQVTTGQDGKALLSFPAKLELWCPERPRLYPVNIITATDTVKELIGFRSIETRGTDILLNGKSVFLKGISFHEEIAQRKGRAYSESDALQLLTWAKELGCNFVRLAHYPQNEHTVRLAEKMGLMLWEEIPVYQGIDFGDPKMQRKMNDMLQEMIRRDKNRCGIIIWSMSNETTPGKARNNCISNMVSLTRSIDPTRLVSSAFDHVRYEGNTVSIDDTLSRKLDVLAVNEYIGWYKAWPSAPGTVTWSSDFNKPLIMSEFGGEALYGNHGPADVASSWSEEYQEQLYKDQVAMLKHIPFLRGTCPWILVDFFIAPQASPGLPERLEPEGPAIRQGIQKESLVHYGTVLPGYEMKNKSSQLQMKSFAIFLFCCLLLGQSKANAQTPPDPSFGLYILMGQSNMAGRGPITDSLKDEGDPRVFMLNKNKEWVPARHPIHFDKPGIAAVGPGLAFGIAMAGYEPQLKIGLIPCAVGGTPIERWVPGAYDSATKTHPYDDAVLRIRAAMQSGVIKGVIWHQGESDSDSLKAEQYLARLQELIRRVRLLTGNPDLPFIVGELGRYRPAYDRINKQLARLPALVPNTALAGSDGLVHKGDTTHFDGRSAEELGRRFASQMYQVQKKTRTK